MYYVCITTAHARRSGRSAKLEINKPSTSKLMRSLDEKLMVCLISNFALRTNLCACAILLIRTYVCRVTNQLQIIILHLHCTKTNLYVNASPRYTDLVLRSAGRASLVEGILHDKRTPSTTYNELCQCKREIPAAIRAYYHEKTHWHFINTYFSPFDITVHCAATGI